ncbi:MAG: ABC transporter substrate-binding protein [Bacteroidota bacterium]
MTLRRVLLVAVCTLIVAASCSVIQASGKVTITFGNFSAGKDNAPTLNAMKAAFEKANPGIKVELRSTGYGDYFTLLQTQVAGGTAPDCYELNYENFVTYAAKNVLLDLGTLGLKKAGYDKNALQAFSYKGKQYGVPGSYSVVLLFYNKDLFDKAGVPYPTNSWTWKDIIEAGKKIRALGENTFGIIQGVHFWEFYKAIAQNNGSLFNADRTKFTVNAPANVEALQYMVDKVNKYNIEPTQAQKSNQGDWDLFVAGRVGMLITGNWAFTYIAEKAKFPWDVAVEPGNKRKACHFFSNGYVINKSSKHKKEAMKWISWLSASRTSTLLRIKAGWETPPISDKEMIELYTSQTPPDNREAVFESLKYLVTPPVTEQFSEMAQIIDMQISKARDLEKTPQQALDDAQKELEQKKIKI